MTEPRDVRLYLDDVLENLRYAREFTADLASAAELAANRKTLYAVVRALEIVGEAAKQVPQPIRDANAVKIYLQKKYGTAPMDHMHLGRMTLVSYLGEGD